MLWLDLTGRMLLALPARPPPTAVCAGLTPCADAPPLLPPPPDSPTTRSVVDTGRSVALRA